VSGEAAARMAGMKHADTAKAVVKVDRRTSRLRLGKPKHRFASDNMGSGWRTTVLPGFAVDLLNAARLFGLVRSTRRSFGRHATARAVARQTRPASWHIEKPARGAGSVRLTAVAVCSHVCCFCAGAASRATVPYYDLYWHNMPNLEPCRPTDNP
jgi:hypothetical protein